MRYHEIDPTYLEEVFDSSVDARWTQQDHKKWTAEFQLHDQRFGVYFENLGMGWVVSYGVIEHGEEAFPWTSNFSPTNQSGTASVKVLSTVVDLVKQFLSKTSPDSLSFTGDKAEGLGSLYARMVKNLQSQLSSIGYTVDQTDNIRYGGTVFKITKMQSESSIEEAFDSVRPIEWKVQSADKWRGTFDNNNERYMVFFDHTHGGWEISYSHLKSNSPDDMHHSNWQFEPTGLSGSKGFVVLGTVLKALEHFLQKVQPQELYFSGKKENGLMDLYTAMAGRLKQRLLALGYKFKGVEPNGNFVIVSIDHSNLHETSTAGSTASGNVATAVGGIGAGFDPNGDHGIYQKARKKTKKPIVIRR